MAMNGNPMIPINPMPAAFLLAVTTFVVMVPVMITS